MQENHKYTLEPYNGMKTRYNCPNCNKKGVFSKYIDTETNAYLSDKVGRCEHINSCSYHYKPKQYFENNNISFEINKPYEFKPPKPKPKPKTSFINVEVMNKSMASNSNNCFIEYLTSLWGNEVAYELAKKYNIGTSKFWKGATVFWQVDRNNNIRSGKIMLYNPTNGKRIKEPYNHINWVHTALKLDNFNLEQCYFGEHLLNEDTSKPIAIVESEKTAIISSIFLPEFIWLACGSVNNLNKAKTKVLTGRNVVLFPDLKCFDLWNDKIPQLNKLATFRTSTLLKDKATEKEKDQGLDLADYLIKQDLRLFKKQEVKASDPEPETIEFDDVEPLINITLEDWSNEIKELENYFKSIELPTESVKLNQCSMITDVALFIESHLSFLKRNNGKKRFIPYLNRLQELKLILT